MFSWASAHKIFITGLFESNLVKKKSGKEERIVKRRRERERDRERERERERERQRETERDRERQRERERESKERKESRMTKKVIGDGGFLRTLLFML